ncbi:MAG TPA: glycosyltransferase [Candidatus Limnocylindrales bacterium]
MSSPTSAGLPPDLRRRIIGSPLVRRRLVEFVVPEAPVERELRASLGRVPANARRYAVVGCGIGSLAWELASRHGTAEVVGFDPDATSIDVAGILFERPNLSFVAGPGDAGALDGFDVWVVAPDATLATATGDPLTPGGSRVVTLAAPGRRAPRSGRELWTDATRSDRVTARLGIRVTADGYLVARRPGPAVLIVMPERGGYSETFIRAQIERLPANVSLLVGSLPNMIDEDGAELVPWVGRAGRGALGGLFGGRATQWLDQFWLRRHLSARHIDVVLAEYGTRGIQMITASRQTGIPLVTHFYGYDGTARTIFQKYERGYRRLFRHGGPLVVVSRHMAARLTSIGADPATLSVIACGVDPQPEAVVPAFEDPPVFLAVARFVEKKAPHMTLLAFAALVRDVPEARLTMVGDGPLLGPCKQLARGLGIESCVEFPGAMPHDRLPDLYRSSRAFVQHSMEASNGDTEGLPVAILEASAAGLPVVSTLHAGIPEAVIDGETGYLVPEGGIDAMADRLRTLANDRALAQRLGSAARRHVTANFALDDTLGRLEDVLESSIARSARGASRRPGRRRRR